MEERSRAGSALAGANPTRPWARPQPAAGGVRRGPHRSTVRSSPRSRQRFGTQDPTTQPLEPILFPKLRICLADFPYLHCPIRLEASDLGDLMRL